MSKLKMLSIVGGLVAAFALSASPASALWVSTNGSTRGTVSVTAAGVFNYGAQGEVKCPASEIKAQWIVQGAGQIKQQLKAATEGPNLLLQVKNWGSLCEAVIGSSPIKPVSVSECSFLATQQAGNFEPTGGTYKGCVVTVGEATSPLCVIQVPAGMEGPQGSGKGINVGLKTIIVGKEEVNTLAKINISEGGEGQQAGVGIFAQSVGKNALCTLKPTTEEATLKGVEGTLNGVKAK